MSSLNDSHNPDWLPKKINNGWTYKTQINKINNGVSLLDFLSFNYIHSSRDEWLKRIVRNQIKINNKIISKNLDIYCGDIVSWEREPWEESSIPGNWEVIFDDGDLLIINKPSGLPVIPGGGFLKHTLSELLKEQSERKNEPEHPRPIHRLGRFTSGVLLCARKKETRNELSKLIRTNNQKNNQIKRVYRGLANPNQELSYNQIMSIKTPIQKEKHIKLGYIWSWQKENNKKSLKALTHIKLLERRKNQDLLEIIIETGRPHQIRIHLASINTPLIGDPLYKLNECISTSKRPGDGGYFLHSHRLENILINNKYYTFEALPPKLLQIN